MSGYKREFTELKKMNVRGVKTCHIADIKASLGLTSRQAPNRIDGMKRMNPCPEHLKQAVEIAVRRVHGI
jgi:hypothetical protein